MICQFNVPPVTIPGVAVNTGGNGEEAVGKLDTQGFVCFFPLNKRIIVF